MGLSNYPAGVDDSHPHFHDETVICERCGYEVPVDEECENCGATLDAELGWGGPDEDSYPERER